MIALWLAGAGLIACTALLLKFPGGRATAQEQDLAQVNLDWYRQREQEIASQGQQQSPDQDDSELLQDAKLRLLEDEQGARSNQSPSQKRLQLWWLLPFVAAMLVGVYHHLGSAADVAISRQLEALGPDSDPAALEQLVLTIERRVEQRPDNIHYLALLGRYYMGHGSYPRAADIYMQLLEQTPEDPQALAYAAQARYLAAERVLDAETQRLAEQALAVDPGQRAALGLLGMASFERQQYHSAVVYWERLLAREAPGSQGYQMISSMLESARQQLVSPQQQAVSEASKEDAAGIAVEVDILAPAGVDVDPTAVVFLFARAADAGTRMPVAVRRFKVADLPLSVVLDDSHSMAGQALSKAGQVMVFAQVSANGQPGLDNAAWVAQAGPIAATRDMPVVQLQLRSKD